MELAFQTKPFPYLKRVIEEVRRQEETAETIVPDSYPDMGYIVNTYAEPILREKDCRSGSVTISGGIKGGIIYGPDGETHPRCLDIYLPFSVKLEHPELTEQSQVVCTVTVRSVDGRIINSRKAMLRAELSCRITAFVKDEEIVCTLQDIPEQLQVRTETYRLLLPLETSEKSFMIGETLDLPAAAKLTRVCKFCCALELGDTKLVGNKGLFKGTASCKLLYQGEDQRLHILRQHLPFSQYCEFDMDFDEETVEFYPMITGYDLDVDRQPPMDKLPVTIHVLMQAVVSGKRELTVPEDAYCTDGQLKGEWKNYPLEAYLDRQSVPMSLRHQMAGAVSDVLDWDVYTDSPEIIPRGDEAELSTGVQIQVLGYDDKGILRGMHDHLKSSYSMALSGSGQCVCRHVSASPLYLSPIPDGLEARVDLNLDTVCLAGQTICGLCAGTVEDRSEASSKRRPSVILRRIPTDARLWDIAKQAGARENAIRDANALDTDQVRAGEVLLIPIG